MLYIGCTSYTEKNDSGFKCKGLKIWVKKRGKEGWTFSLSLSLYIYIYIYHRIKSIRLVHLYVSRYSLSTKSTNGLSVCLSGTSKMLHGTNVAKSAWVVEYTDWISSKI